jgi:16S rRNA (cytidine1402-2'-O)-methyltransferase
VLYASEAPPKGEIVVLVGPPAAARPVSDSELDAYLRTALAGGVKAAASEAAQVLGVPRKRAYARALALKDQT